MLKFLLLTFSAVNQLRTKAYDMEHNMATVMAEDAEQVQDTSEAENREDANPTLQNEFDKLMSRYYATLVATAGCGGDRAQDPINAEYGGLSKFADEHPEFKAQLPQKHVVRSDGRDGRSGGVAAFADTYRQLP